MYGFDCDEWLSWTIEEWNAGQLEGNGAPPGWEPDPTEPTGTGNPLDNGGPSEPDKIVGSGSCGCGRRREPRGLAVARWCAGGVRTEAPLTLLSLVLAGTALGEVPLPNYPDVLARQRWNQANDILDNECSFDPGSLAMVCAEGATDRVIELVDTFQDQVFEDAGLEYLAGLAARYDGDNSRAIRRYSAALAIDPTDDAAWYDLGEIYLGRSEWADARDCFTHVAELHDDGPKAWVGPWRLSEVAAHTHDAAAFETQIKLALRRGFTFRQVAGLPNWRAFYADPALHDVIDSC